MSGGGLKRIDRPEAKLLMAEFKTRTMTRKQAEAVIRLNEHNTRLYLAALKKVKLIRVCDWERTLGNFAPVYGYNPDGTLEDAPKPKRLTGAEYSRRWHQRRKNEIERFKTGRQLIPTVRGEIHTIWATWDGKNPIGEHGTATCLNRNRTGFTKHAW